jgi:Fic family protein
MDLKDFQSGTYTPQGDYKAFSPAPINHTWLWTNPLVNTLLEEANTALGELNAFSRIVPNVELFITMHIAKEATDSSRIEGTRTAIDEVFLEREAIEPEKQDDWEEVQNYIAALKFAIEQLNSLPLSLRLIRDTHKVLMAGVRGQSKAPGEFRKVQNWIGGRSLQEATFIPPAANEVVDLMSDMEAFLHNSSIHVPHLIRIAIAHYQFETIHPFLDGNGRTGRLLITLYLLAQGVLQYPTLYLSDYLEKKRQEYFDRLNDARVNSRLESWIIFFLGAVIETSQKGSCVFQNILTLREQCESQVLTLGRRAKRGRALLELLYGSPSVTVQKVSDELGITARPAGELLELFIEMGILEEVTGFKRNRVFQFTKYLDLFRG